MFGFRGFGLGRRRGGLGGGLRNALITGAGMMAWRWWKNRQETRQRTPGPIGPDRRRTYDTGPTDPSGGSF